MNVLLVFCIIWYLQCPPHTASFRHVLWSNRQCLFYLPGDHSSGPWPWCQKQMSWRKVEGVHMCILKSTAQMCNDSCSALCEVMAAYSPCTDRIRWIRIMRWWGCQATSYIISEENRPRWCFYITQNPILSGRSSYRELCCIAQLMKYTFSSFRCQEPTIEGKHDWHDISCLWVPGGPVALQML